MMNQDISVFGPKNNFVEYIRCLAAFMRSFDTNIDIHTYCVCQRTMHVIYVIYDIYGALT